MIELTDLNGKVLATSRGGAGVDVAGQDWFQAAAGWPAGGDITVCVRAIEIRWIVAQPVMDRQRAPGRRC